MSRSKPSQCSGGRGCWVCGDAGANRRAFDDMDGRLTTSEGLEEHAYDEPPEYCDGDCWFCSPGDDYGDWLEANQEEHHSALRVPLSVAWNK